MIAHSKRIVGYVLANKRMLIVVAFILLAMSRGLSLLSQKLDEQGICWMKGRGLTNDELYQQAMQDFVQNLFEINDAYRVRRGLLGFKRRAADFYYCDKRDCDVWVAPPLTFNDVLELKNKFRVDSAYLSLPPDTNISDVLGMRRISTISEAGIFKQAHNSNAIVTTDSYGTSDGRAVFYPANCCAIYTAIDWNTLVQKYPHSFTTNRRLSEIHAKKFLIVKKIFAPEIDLGFDGQYVRDISHNRPQTHLYNIDACGNIQAQKADYSYIPADFLELYPMTKE